MNNQRTPKRWVLFAWICGLISGLPVALSVDVASADAIFTLQASATSPGGIPSTGAGQIALAAMSGGLGDLRSFTFTNVAGGITYSFTTPDVKSLSYTISGNGLTLNLTTNPVLGVRPEGVDPNIQNGMFFGTQGGQLPPNNWDSACVDNAAPNCSFAFARGSFTAAPTTYPTVYEDWQEGLVRSIRWFGGESFGAQEVGREVTSGNLLELGYRRGGSRASNTGSTSSEQFLNITDATRVLAIEAAFTVTDLTMTVCAANNAGAVTRARPARLLMSRFNDGTQSVPGNRLGDYLAGVQAFRDGSSTDPANVLNVVGFINRCTNASCATSTGVVSNTLATTVSVGQLFTLRLKWDPPNHQFLFGLDGSADIALPYAASDTAPSNVPFVNIDVSHTTANCTAGAVAIDSTVLVGIVSTAGILTDVSTSDPFFTWIEALFAAGVTGGCSANPPQYCPDGTATRGEMAVFLLRGIHGGGYQPPAATGTMFTDVLKDNLFAPWIEQLAREGITGGCATSPPAYCPEDTVTRGQMAVFLLRAKHGAGYQPPAATGTMFTDVPVSYPFAPWIEQLAREGITGGCGTKTTYCPDIAVTRGQMAVFLVRAFNLPM